MTVKVSFSDLTHAGKVVATDTFPLGSCMIAANAQKILGNEIDFEVFRYPADFSTYLKKNIPDLACFSAFSWNICLSHEYARKIKKAFPKTITIFGGPEFPSKYEEQKAFLEKYPAIDCFFEFEGEMAFIEMFKAMQAIDFDWERFKRERRTVPSIRYLTGGEMIVAELMPQVTDLDSLPSPHLSGISDKFYDGVLTPMMQTARGCPYSCTFCWEGGDYFRKIKRFSQERIETELNYIVDRVTVPDLYIVDANFGMFKEDLETTHLLAGLKEKHGWPKYMMTATAKNHKKRMIEIVGILGSDTMSSSFSVQNTDEGVLKNIKRKNPPLDQIITMSDTANSMGGQSKAELILCLEGDSKTAHFQSVFDMLDAGMSYIRTYQFRMLRGTESESKESREQYGLETKYRVLNRCFGTYEFRGESFSSVEIEEIVVASNTMSYADYQDCRHLGLTGEIFNNDSYFVDLIKLLNFHGIKRSKFIKAVDEAIKLDMGPLASLYCQFTEEEEKNSWNSCEEVEEFSQKPGVIQRYIDGEYGANELYKYRALAIVTQAQELHRFAFQVARFLLDKQISQNPVLNTYITELQEFSLLRKTDLINIDQFASRKFHFNFAMLLKNLFVPDPMKAYQPEGIEVEVFHSDSQRELISGYIRQYGEDLIGDPRLLIRNDINLWYRTARNNKGDGAKEMVSPELNL